MKEHRSFCPYCMNPVEEGEACGNCGLTAGTYTPSPHHLPPGTVLMDRYLVGRVLGEGGFGITYIGCDLRLELRVAIKEYFPTDKVTRNAQSTMAVTNYIGMVTGSYEAGKAKFLYEARTMARMDKQPVIVSVRDFFEANNTAYIVMEYVEGTTFKELAAQQGGRIPAGLLLHTIEPLFSALSNMHAQGLIHRDISPDNLMLEHGAVRLLDFGCARESANGEATMTISLKNGYAPVEQYQNKGQGPWTDVYALSATIYYCLTGKRPPQAMDRLVEDELIPPRQLGAELTEQQEQALLHGMGIRPRRRFQSMEELHAALYEGRVPPQESEQELGQGQEQEQEREPEPELEDMDRETAPKPELRLWLKRHGRLCGGLAALLAVICLAAVVLLPRSQNAAPEPEPEPEPQASLSAPVEQDGGEAQPVLLSSTIIVSSEADLRAALENDDYDAVSLTTGLALTDGPLEIAKPLLIGEGAQLTSWQPVTVSGDGALQIEGSFGADLLRTTGGGSISVGASGTLRTTNGSGLVWLEHAEDLTVEPGGTTDVGGKSYGDADSGDRYLVLCEEELFADAVHVNTEAELRAAIDRPGVTAVVIDSSLTLSKDLGSSIPVLISEGVTVSNFTWYVDRTVLMNRGTLVCDVNVGDWDNDLCAIINYGVIDGVMFLNCPGSLVNYGEITVPFAYVEKTNLYNLGVLTHRGDENEDGLNLNIFCATACNFGELVETGSNDGYITLSHGVNFNNTGTIRVERGGALSNEATLDNMGLLRVDAGGRLDNIALLMADDFPNGVLDLDPDSTLGNVGLLQLSYGRTLDFPNNVENCGGSTACFLLDWDKAYDVGTEDALRSGLNGEFGDAPLCINSADIAVNGDLTVGRTLAVSGASSLTLTGGNLTVTGQDTFLFCQGVIDLGGGTLILTDGAVLLGRIVNCGGITIEEQAKLVTTGLDMLPSSETGGTQITLDSVGHLINMNNAALDDVSIRISDFSVFRTLGALEAVNCGVEVDDNGELLVNTADFTLYNTVLTISERGYFSANDMTVGSYTCKLWSVENHGWMEFGMSTQLGVSGDGASVNYGTIQFQFWTDLTVAGALDNQGTMLAEWGNEVQTANGGSFTGNEPEARSEWVDRWSE